MKWDEGRALNAVPYGTQLRPVEVYRNDKPADTYPNAESAFTAGDGYHHGTSPSSEAVPDMPQS